MNHFCDKCSLFSSTLRQNGEMEGMQGDRWNWKRYTCVQVVVRRRIMMIRMIRTMMIRMIRMMMMMMMIIIITRMGVVVVASIERSFFTYIVTEGLKLFLCFWWTLAIANV